DRLRTSATELLEARRRVGSAYRLPFLTPREHLVLSQLCHGHPNKVIARNLGMSENTVKTHLKSIFRKADVQSREQAIELARRLMALAEQRPPRSACAPRSRKTLGAGSLTRPASSAEPLARSV